MQNNVHSFYHAADGLILPTLYDPFPNVILEAMACGLPVITSTRCGGAEFIEYGKQGFVCDALDINALSEAANAIPSNIAGFSRWATPHATESLPYTPQRLASELHSLYQQGIANRPDEVSVRVRDLSANMPHFHLFGYA